MKLLITLLLTSVLLTTIVSAEDPPLIPWPTLDVTPTKITADAFLALSQRHEDTVTFPAGLYEITEPLVLAEADTTYQMHGVELWSTDLSITGDRITLDTLCLVCTDVQVSGEEATLKSCCIEQLTLTSVADGLTLEHCYIDGHVHLTGDDLRIVGCSYKFFNLTCTGDRVTLEGNSGNHMETGTWHFTDCVDLRLIGNTMDPSLTRVYLDGCSSAEMAGNVNYVSEKVDGAWNYKEVLLMDFWGSNNADCHLRGSNVSMKQTRLGAAVRPRAVGLPRLFGLVVQE